MTTSTTAVPSTATHEPTPASTSTATAEPTPASTSAAATEPNPAAASAPARTYKLASWNVNGLRAVLKKDPGFAEIVEQLDADILGLQETKLQEGQVDLDLPGYHQVWSYAERKGYSGTAVFTREEPLSVRHADSLLAFAGEGEAAELLAVAVTEGRVCALEFDRFWYVDVYTPNAQNELARLDTRMAWDDAYRAFLKNLEEETGKPVITCGDFNVAHEEIDLKNPKSNRGNAGFSDEERGKFTELLDAGFTDTWRTLNPGVEGVYSWWSYRFNARKNNAGWRIDYFLVSDAIAPNIRDARIRNDIFGSDHCPVELEIEL